jgi:hypothetical protein
MPSSSVSPRALDRHFVGHFDEAVNMLASEQTQIGQRVAATLDTVVGIGDRFAYAEAFSLSPNSFLNFLILGSMTARQ